MCLFIMDGDYFKGGGLNFDYGDLIVEEITALGLAAAYDSRFVNTNLGELPRDVNANSLTLDAHLFSMGLD